MVGDIVLGLELVDANRYRCVLMNFVHFLWRSELMMQLAFLLEVSFLVLGEKNNVSQALDRARMCLSIASKREKTVTA